MKLILVYFEVPKSDTEARTILNGRILSRVCYVPPAVNVMDMADLLKWLGTNNITAAVYTDIRHWFHELTVNEFLSSMFTIRCADVYYRWLVLPMGWTWSPRLCQCIAWILILSFPEKAKRPFYFDIPQSGLEELPRFVVVRDKVSDKAVGMVTLLYDNIGAFFWDENIATSFLSHIQANYARFRVEPKFLQILNKKTLSRNNLEKLGSVDAEAGKLQVKYTVYRGVQIGLSLHGKTIWRCDPAKVIKWKNLPVPVVGKTTPRKVATVVCTIIWITTVHQQPLCCISEVIDILRQAGKLGSHGWDQETIILSEEEVRSLTIAWSFVIANPWRIPTDLKDLRRMIFATDASNDGAGMSMLQAPFHVRSYQWKIGINRMTIFLRELQVATYWINKFLDEGYTDLVVLIDNTAAGHVLRRLYSTNSIACRWMGDLAKRIEGKAKITVITVKSEDNVADNPSRALEWEDISYEEDDWWIVEYRVKHWKVVQPDLLKKCMDLAEDELRGIRRTTAPADSWKGNSDATGSVRHQEPDELDEDEFGQEDVESFLSHLGDDQETFGSCPLPSFVGAMTT
jgi:hypothetical protein